MTDFALRWTDTYGADVVIDGADLLNEDGLYTAVVISLFTDRRARPGDDYDGEDPRGWWADSEPDVPGDETGSHNWLLAREKQTPLTADRARRYANEALQWMLTDGVARRIEVQAEWIQRGVLALYVQIHRPNQAPAEYRFKGYWQGALNAA